MTALESFLAGNFTAGILIVYTDVWGVGLFYFFVWFLVFVCLYITSQSIVAPSIVSLLLGAILIVNNRMPVVVHRVGYFIMVFALASVLYQLWRNRR